MSRVRRALLAVRFWAVSHPRLVAYLPLVAAIYVRNMAGLASSPPGLYVDESSIAYNAWTLGHNGVDEHGVGLPLYPAAFGEYKNPVYIYVLALFERIFGLSVFVTRLPAALFGLLTCIFLALAVYRITRSHGAAWITLLLAGVTPWLTLESRLGFEVISMVALLALMLWCLAQAASAAPDDLRSATRWYAFAGGAAAIAIFAYSTARLEIGGFAVALVASFAYRWRRRWWVTLAPIAVGYAILGEWILGHPNALTARYNLISITVDRSTGATRPLADIWHLFWANYWQYLSPDFLFVHGDANLRHNTGWAGMLLLPTVVLLGAGVVWCVRHIRDPLPRLLLLCIPVAPVAAALTNDGTPHSLRSVDMLPFLLAIAGCGVAGLSDGTAWLAARAGASVALRRAMPTAIVALSAIGLTAWAVPYTADLYGQYPDKAAAWFDTGEVDAIIAAHGMAAGHTVYLVTDGFAGHGFLDQPYIDAAFAYAGVLRPPAAPTADSPGVLLGQLGMVQVGTLDPALLHPGDLVVTGMGDQTPPGTRLVAQNGVAEVYQAVSIS